MNMDIEDRCVYVASHAVGLDNRKPYTRHGKKFYKPYRNFYSTAPKRSAYAIWRIMEDCGFAKSVELEQGVIFQLTRAGLDWLGAQLGVCIYNEEG